MGRFRIKPVATGFKFDLLAANGQIIATSDWYDFEINGKLWSREFYEEVLKRFKEAKK